ncbi:SLC45 family MFS transporter [Paenibacillus prosopidis]|uniref:Na+/melibiose symporter-like transporter n=1 Tax=Paenibacillus prosopidis TaxID=630520 RepID=A0A368W1N7_9BACL|nr:SLC45 family MFS transporter [Paenibacillus prosopidis]RCW48947.1 Na+/melibiose symporter-like transporter [Paenibacillus prosopidis]
MKKTWLLGFGFFSISITWALYNAFVPFFLDDFLKSTLLIGFMMTIDNYFALFLQPWIGSRSDRTNSRFGKRMPYLLIGMPLAALFGALIPWHTGLLTLILFMVLMNLSMSLYRSPTVALMPDITPDNKRTQANGVINFMGGIGSIIAFGGGAFLYEMHSSLPFLSASILTLICLAILLYTIKEKRDAVAYAPADHKPTISFKGEWNRPTLFLLGAIFFWFLSYQGVEAFFTLYGKNHLQLTEGQSSFSLAFFSLAFVLAAIPSGLLGNRFGKKPVIAIGVVGLILIFAAISFVDSLLPLRIMLIVGGIFWAMININSYPFIIALGKEQTIGTRTGIYYLVSSLAAITSPPLMGGLIDLFGYSVLFYFASGGMVIALLFLAGVRDKGLTKTISAQNGSTNI